MFLNLTIAGGLAGAILSGVFFVADPMIKANKARELREAIFVVLPGARDFKTVKRSFEGEDITIYVGVDEVSSPVGVAFKADGNGFQGNVGLMVGLDTEYFKLKGMEVLEQVETPGLGDRIREEEFKAQFRGVEVRPRIEYIKYRKPEKPNQIQAITGATISSDAVVKNINRAVARVLSALPKDELSGPAITKLPTEGDKAAKEQAAKEQAGAEGTAPENKASVKKTKE